MLRCESEGIFLLGRAGDLHPAHADQCGLRSLSTGGKTGADSGGHPLGGGGGAGQPHGVLLVLCVAQRPVYLHPRLAVAVEERIRVVVVQCDAPVDPPP